MTPTLHTFAPFAALTLTLYIAVAASATSSPSPVCSRGVL
jgi:hypothetical protein